MNVSEWHNLTKNFDLLGSILTFLTENKPKIVPSKAKNNANKIFEHLQSNFEKAQKTGYLPLKWSKWLSLT